MKMNIEHNGERYVVVAQDGTSLTTKHVELAEEILFNTALLKSAGAILVLKEDYDGEGTPMVVFKA